MQIYVILYWLKKKSITFAFMNRQKYISILEHEAEAIRNIPITEEYDKAINLIYSQIHKRGGTVITSGMGKAGHVAMNIATTFSSTGTPAYFLHPSEAQHGDLGIIRKNDMLLLVSNSGRTRELMELVQLARGMIEEIKYIIITSNPDSQLAKAADACLFTGSPTEVCPLGLTPTTSITTMTVIGDLLVSNLMQQIYFSCSDYAKRHHGGYLGSKSRKQSKEENKKQ